MSSSFGAPSARSSSGASIRRSSTSSSVASRASSSPGAADVNEAAREAIPRALERRPMPLEPGRSRAKLGRVRHEPGQNDDARRLPRERLGDGDQRLGVPLLRDGDENRALLGLVTRCGCGGLDVQRGILTQDRALQLLKGGARLDPELRRRGPGAHPGRHRAPPPADPTGTAPSSGISAAVPGAGARRRAPRAPRPARRGARGRGRRRSGARAPRGVSPRAARSPPARSSRTRSPLAAPPSTATAPREAAATRRPRGRPREGSSPRPPGARSGADRVCPVRPGSGSPATSSSGCPGPAPCAGARR